MTRRDCTHWVRRLSPVRRWSVLGLLGAIVGLAWLVPRDRKDSQTQRPIARERPDAARAGDDQLDRIDGLDRFDGLADPTAASPTREAALASTRVGPIIAARATNEIEIRLRHPNANAEAERVPLRLVGPSGARVIEGLSERTPVRISRPRAGEALALELESPDLELAPPVRCDAASPSIIVLEPRTFGRLVVEVPASEPLASAGPYRVFAVGSEREESAFDVLSSGRFEVCSGPATIEFERLPPGGYRVFCEPPHESDSPDARIGFARVRPGETTRLTIGERPPTTRLHGLVTRAARPLPGARVRILLASDSSVRIGGPPSAHGLAVPIQSGADGRFEADLPVGPHEVRIAAADSSLGPTEFRIEVPDSVEFREEFALPASRVRGRVVRADGTPVADVEVCLRPTWTGEDATRATRHGRATCASDGRFEFDALNPGGYRFTVGGPVRNGAVGEGREALANQRVRIDDPAQTIDDLEFVLPAPTSLEGTVVEADGQAVARARLYLREEGPGRAWFPVGRCDDEGRFRLDALGTGPYRLYALDTSRSLARDPHGVQVQPSAFPSRVELVASPVRRIEIEALDANGAPLPCRAWSFTPEGEPLPCEGRQSLLKVEQYAGYLPKGRYVAHVWFADHQRVEREFEVTGDEPVRLRVRRP